MVLRIVSIMLLLAALPAFAQSHRNLYMYQGADREQRLIEGAKKEKQVVVYTSLNTKDSVPISQAFEKKYGVKVELWRSSSEKVLQRALTEARAGRHSVDAFELNGPEMEALYREGLLEEFYSPHFRTLPPAAFAKHKHYVADRFNFFTIAYNTNLVKPNEVPNSYEDLLNPRWVGKIGIEGSDDDWFASIVKHMGEDKGLAFFRKLAQMKPQIRTGHTLLAELVAAGEIPAGGDDLQPQRRAPARERRADQVEGAQSDVRPPERRRGDQARAAAARRVAVHRFHDLARRPGAAQAAQPRAGEHRGRDQPEQISLPHDRSGDRARRDPRSGRRSGPSCSSRDNRSSGRPTNGQRVSLQQQERSGLRPRHPGPVQPEGRARAAARRCRASSRARK